MTFALTLLDADGNTAFDFTDKNGTTNPYGLKCNLPIGGFKLAPPDPEESLFAGEEDGGALAETRDPVGEGVFTVFVGPQGTVQELFEGVNELGRMLKAGGTIKEVPDVSLPTRYWDFITGTVPALFRGQAENLYWIVQRKHDLGLPIRLVHQPHPRGEENPLRNKADNPMLLWDRARDGRPDGWSWDTATEISGEAIEQGRYEGYSFDLTSTGALTRALRQTAQPASVGQSWTFGFEGRVVSGPGQIRARIEFLDSGDLPIGAAAESPLAAPSSFTKPATRQVITAVAPAGTVKVRYSLVASNTGAGTGRYHFRQAQPEQASSASPFAVGAQLVSNDPALSGGCVLPLWIPSTAPTPLHVIVEGETGASLVEVLGAIRSNKVGEPRNLADLLNETKAARLDASADGWTVSGGTDVSVIADTAASSGSALEISHVTTPTTALMRRRVVRTTKTDSLRGELAVYVPLRAMGNKKFWPHLRWGIGPAVVHTEPEVAWNVSGASSFDVYGLAKLGTIKIPEKPAKIGQLTLELWTRQDTTGAVALRAGTFILIPVDQRSLIVKIPTGKTAVGATEQFRWDARHRPGDPEKTDQSGNHHFLLDAETHAPVVPPELVLLFLQFGDSIITGHPRPKHVIARKPTASASFAPAWNN